MPYFLEHPIPLPLTLESILAHEFMGNAASDCVAFRQIDEWCHVPDRPHADIVAVWNHVAIEGINIDWPMALSDVPAYLTGGFD